MKYDLAKELKDAEFPQKQMGRNHILPSGEILPYIQSNTAYIPTLEELIEACGNNLHVLVHEINGGLDSNREWWSAGKDNIVKDWFTAPTATEAIALFWISLNKKV